MKKEVSMAAKSRRKGARAEREVIELARQHGLQAERTWKNAQAADSRERVRDVKIGPDFYQVRVEAKGFARMYREMEGVRKFFFRRDRGKWLVTLRAQNFLRLLAAARNHPEEGPGQVKTGSRGMVHV